MIQVDLHNHTTFSGDSFTTPKALVEQLVVHPTIKAAAVTDHGSIEGVSAVKALAAPYPDILIMPGVEITTPRGDILVLGTEELPPTPWTVEAVVDFAKETDCVSVAAHPFREWGLGESAATSGVDAIEILNGGSSAIANRKARDLAREFGLPGVAGSDSHRPSDLFSVYTEIQASLDVDEILKAIKKGLISVFAAEKSIRF
ncbi:MAG: PHP domain-containing protein [Candidatus Bathyarchaeota archaeon]|nr:PHP domain-containing protein [Candidatus Bathyarchaeota archaeon]